VHWQLPRNRVSSVGRTGYGWSVGERSNTSQKIDSIERGLFHLHDVRAPLSEIKRRNRLRKLVPWIDLPLKQLVERCTGGQLAGHNRSGRSPYKQICAQIDAGIRQARDDAYLPSMGSMSARAEDQRSAFSHLFLR
jgi:hypothetical protein